MKTSVSQLIDEMFRRGFTPHGIAFVLSIIADELEEAGKLDPEFAFRHNDFQVARLELLND